MRSSICNSIGCDTAQIFVTVQCDELIIYNGFSPNNDPGGINETFVIRGINDLYPDHTVRIYNRWGNLVYETQNYENNEWSGQWDGQDVPDGTYFYVIDLGTGQYEKGYVQLHR